MTDSHDPAPVPAAAEGAVLDFLRRRRSCPPRALAAPGPDAAQLAPLLEAAVRVPDHGKLVPWRLVVLEAAACRRLAALTDAIGAAEGRDPGKLAKDIAGFAEAPLIVAVIAVPRPTDKVPRWEQEASAACVCLSLLNAALAAGWGAVWLTGWRARHAGFLAEGLGLADGETVAGFVHIGTAVAEVADRPRPEAASLTTWVTT